MPKISYLASTSGSSPYIKMIKVIDGVPENATTFSFAETPVGLNACGWSPDGKYFLALRSQNINFTVITRLWRLDDIDDFVEIASPSSAPSQTVTAVTELAWLTNTHIVASSSSGLLFGVLNRTTDVITWSVVNTTSITCLAVHPDGVHFFTSNGSTPFITCYQRTGDTVATKSISGGPGQVVSRIELSNDGLFMVCALTTTPHLIGLTVDAGVTTLTQVALSVEDRPNTTLNWVDITPDGLHAFIVTTTGERVRSYLRIGSRLVVGDKGTGFAVALNTICANVSGDSELVAIAVGSNAATTGRVRVAGINPNNELMEDKPEFNALYTDAISYNRVVWSPIFDTGGSVSLYDSFIETAVSGALNLTSLKLCLVNSSASFNRSHTTLASVVGANEVFGNEWPTGGIAATGEAYVRGTEELYSLTATFPTVDYTGTGLTFRAAVLYDDADTDKKPICFYNFGVDQTIATFDRVAFGSAGNRLVDFRKA